MEGEDLELNKIHDAPDEADPEHKILPETISDSECKPVDEDKELNENPDLSTEEVLETAEEIENENSGLVSLDNKESTPDCKEDLVPDDAEHSSPSKDAVEKGGPECACGDDVEPEEKRDESVEKEVNLLAADRTLEDSEDEDNEFSTNINTDDPKERILWAAEKNEVDVVRQLIDEDPSLVNAKDEDLYTPLHRACSNNHTEIIKLLLASGADLGARTEDDWCPLHCACRWDSVEAASLLLQNGANINATSKGGLSPLHLAAANSSGRRTLELLLWNPHVDGTLRAENGDTAYDIACRTSNTLLRLFELLDESNSFF